MPFGPSTPYRLRVWGEDEGDFLHILGCGGHQALATRPDESAEAGIAVAEELLGVGEGALHGFLTARIDQLAPNGQAVGVGAVAGVLPNMPGNGAFGLGVRGA
jgi:hypothetical protein